MPSGNVRITDTTMKRQERKCKFCGDTIPPDKRADSKFCSNSCKANHWEEHKGKKEIPVFKPALEKELQKTPEKTLEGLRGVIENKLQSDGTAVKQPSNGLGNSIITDTKITQETQVYKDALAKKEKTESDYHRVQDVLAQCDMLLEQWQVKRESLKRVRPNKWHQTAKMDYIDLHDPLWDEMEESYNRIEKQTEIEDKIIELTDTKMKLELMLPGAKGLYEGAERKLKSVQQYETVKQNTTSQLLGLLKGVENMKLQPKIEEPEQIKTDLKQQGSAECPVELPSNGKIISSKELREISYKCLNFQNKWKDFFGLPAVVFHLAVHGKPGEGKSTFCMQFADYLAKNFGRVIYISGEEGFSKTLQDKVVNLKINNQHLFFADINSFEQIKTVIPDNKFHFIFIDSLDTLRIDALRLRELREQYSQSGFITISQSTKDGKMRGSQEIIHDADITVKVEDGTATTTKNRYLIRGKEFEVFPEQGNAGNKLKEPKNLI
jgi:predicted nucleic acid-binding Zn ribbon protein